MTSSVDYLTREQVAERYHLSVSYLAQAAGKKPRFHGPRYIKLGRKVLYRASDVEGWLAARLVTPTVPNGRGRPSKAAIVARRQQAEAHR